MQYEIRAMTLGEILDTAFRILRDHAKLLISLGLIFAVPMAAVSYAAEILATPAALESNPAMIAIGGALLLLLLLVATTWPFAMAAITHSIGELYLGRPVSFGEASRFSVSIFLPLVGTTLLAMILVVVLIGVLGGIAFVAFSVSPWLGSLLLLPISFFYFYLSLLFALLSQVIVLEHAYGLTALRRCAELVRGHMLRTFAVLLVAGILTAVVNIGVTLALSFSPLATAAGNAVAQALWMGFSAGTLVLLYFDIRCRKEAYDLDHLAQEVERAGPTPAPIA